ncbi:galactose-3-O-sulfotransferase 2 [Sardina pilchardus]|uniref:galactose-3-O-sulfotransferase 2 n=1 Tax=Sardina pilchardus TaxID=27697 RepID=UPI002E0E22C5
MTLRWVSHQFWRHRMTGLLVTLAVTLLLMLLATHSLHPLSQKPVVEKRAEHENAEHKQKQASHKENSGRKSGEVATVTQPTEDITGSTTERRRRNPPPIVFLKTHKTGSSTVQNLLFRLGEREKATFAFPYYTYQFSYPERFRAEFVDELPDGSSQFDILCSHMRLDLAQVKKVMPQNSVYVTLLRDPLNTFESVFNYYTSAVPAFAEAQKAADAAAAVAAAAGFLKRKSALTIFLEKPEAYWDPKEVGNGLAKNPMCFDMGLNSLQWNSSWPEDLARLEETFHLVMIAEHFDESLVLLGALLGVGLDELAYVRLNVRSVLSVATLDQASKERASAWNALDALLYDFFLQLFWEKAEMYGRKRLTREVAQLRKATEDVRRTCVAREGVPPGQLEDLVRPWQTNSATVMGYELKANLSQLEQGFCVRLVLPELQYHSHLYFQQYGRDMRSVPTD